MYGKDTNKIKSNDRKNLNIPNGDITLAVYSKCGEKKRVDIVNKIQWIMGNYRNTSWLRREKQVQCRF
jgi:hypothetical protein